MCALKSSQMMNRNYNFSRSFDDGYTLATISQSLSEDSGTIFDSTKRRNRRGKSYNARSMGIATSAKKHDAPMQKKDVYFAIDCEMVGVGPEGLDSALARVSITNWDNEVVLDTFVRVQEEVTDYRTFVSGIRPEHIQSEAALSLIHVRILVAQILNGKMLIGHGLENDLKALDLQHPWCDIRDTAKYAPFMRTISKENDEKILRPKKLKDLVWENFHKEIQVIGKSHSSIEDAIAAMDLYKVSREEWEIQVAKEVNRVASSSPIPAGPPCSPQLDSREPLDNHHRTPMGARVGCDHGNQLLFHHQHQRLTAQFVMPMLPPSPIARQHQHQHQQLNFEYEYPINPNTHGLGHGQVHHHNSHTHNHMNGPLPTPPNGIGNAGRLISARRTQELARAKVIAALHQQRRRWQQKQQLKQNQQRQNQMNHSVHAVHRMPM